MVSSVQWAFRDRYFIRSACDRFNVSKCFIRDRAIYRAWYTANPKDKFCHAAAIGICRDNLDAAIADCDEFVRLGLALSDN